MKKADGRLKRFLLASLVSPEMLFVRDVATQVVFMDSGSKAPQRSSSKARAFWTLRHLSRPLPRPLSLIEPGVLRVSSSRYSLAVARSWPGGRGPRVDCRLWKVQTGRRNLNSWRSNGYSS